MREKLADGSYVVTWRVISADSHPVQGAFAFQVGTSANATSPQVNALKDKLLGAETSDHAVGALYGVDRGVLFGGIALLIGGAAFAMLVWPASRRVAPYGAHHRDRVGRRRRRDGRRRPAAGALRRRAPAG